MADGLSVVFDIPSSWYMSCVGAESVKARADMRRRLRRYGRGVWRDAKLQGLGRYKRFVLLVTVAGRRDSPVLACETLKPLIDAGTDEKIWPDDDPFHRVSTCYLPDPTPCPVGRVRIGITIIPLGARERMPGRIVSKVPDSRAAAVCLTVPDGDWLTSNMRLDVRERRARQSRIMRAADCVWGDKALGGSVGVLCSVRYPDSRAEWVGDPDNTAESATALYGMGVAKGLVPYNPSLFGFYLAGGQADAHSHDLSLLAFTVPPGFNWIRAMLE